MKKSDFFFFFGKNICISRYDFENQQLFLYVFIQFTLVKLPSSRIENRLCRAKNVKNAIKNVRFWVLKIQKNRFWFGQKSYELMGHPLHVLTLEFCFGACGGLCVLHPGMFQRLWWDTCISNWNFSATVMGYMCYPLKSFGARSGLLYYISKYRVPATGYYISIRDTIKHIKGS